MRKLNNKIKKIGAPILAGVLACSTALFYVPQMNAVHADTEKSINENFPEMLKTAQTGDKSETVYAVMDADGNTTDVSVSEWLKNEGKSNNLSDYSNLKNIKNTSGDEKMSRDGNKLVWAAKGKDIHYTGDYDGELPVKVKVSYYLNGTKVSADEIAGKKGNVKIRFDYDINDSVKENGYSLTRPYAIVSAVVLSNDNFTNVTVNNGKAVNDGNSTAVVGIALPGMSDNLQIDELDIPDHVTINAKTTNFEIDGTYTVADSGFMNDVDTTKLDDATGQIDELESALDKLSDASKKLVDGSSKLAKGANKLANSSSQIEEGTETLKDGTKSMKNGSKDLKAGTGDLKQGTGDLKTGVKDLSDGADKLVAGAQDLSSGTTQMKEGTEALNSSVNGADGLAGDNGSAKKLSAGAARVDAGIKQMGETLAAQNDKLAQTAKSISDNLDGVNTEKVNAPSYADVDSALEIAIKAAEASGDQDTINALKNAKEKLGTYETNVKDTVSSVNTDKQKIITANQTAKGMYQQSIAFSSNDDLKKLQDGADELKAGTQALDTAVNVGGTKADGTKVPSLSKAVAGLNSGAAQLDAGVNGYTDKDGKFHPGALLGLRSLQAGIKVDTKDKTSLVTGVNKLDAGANKLDAGTTKLANGAVQVDAGAGKLVTYMGQLTEGAETLSDGADTLASGMATFNKTGIQKLVSTLKDSDIKSMVNRVKATLDAASDGSFIGGKQDGQSGESKIIFKTDEVKKASKSDK
ncbi:MAG: hypothetical protein UDF26_06220 [Clostridia bacterium]|nr:hypothetical protein [Clostridia bacterium]